MHAVADLWGCGCGCVVLQVKEISDNYLKLEEFQYENVDRASKACGPLNK